MPRMFWALSVAFLLAGAPPAAGADPTAAADQESPRGVPDRKGTAIDYAHTGCAGWAEIARR